MAKFVVLDPIVVFAGSTVTQWTSKVTISLEAENVDVTAFGGNGWRQQIGGLKSGTVDFDFHVDFAAGSIDELMFDNLGGTVAVTVRPGGTAAISDTNPEYQFNVLVTAYQPVDSSVGDLATTSVSLPVDGVVTRATA